MAITKIEVPELFDFGSDNSAFKLPTGTTAERPTSPSNGEMRFNTTTGYVEYYDTTDAQWWEIDYAPSFASKNFNTVLWTGDSTARTISTGFASDFVWIKSRSFPRNHYLYDSIRGANNQILSNSTDSETTVAQRMTGFDSNGFDVGTSGEVNTTNETYVSWSWVAGGTAVSNTDGTVTSQVSANTAAGFSISTFTSNASTLTAGHGLNSTPDLIIVKATSFADSWFVNSSALTNRTDRALRLNQFSAEETNNAFWNNTAPTSTTFSLGSGVSVSGQSYVAYCWHSVAGYSKIGKYTGQSTSAVTVSLDFTPRFVVIKDTSGNDYWHVWDTARSPSNNRQEILYWDLSEAEANSASNYIQINTNEFVTNTGNLANINGNVYLYMAFA